MTQEERMTLKAQILQDIQKLQEEISDLELLTKPIAPDCCLGDLGRFEIMHDQATSERTLHESNKRLNRLTYALRRVDGDTYGICEVCEDTIALERLMIIPESTRCIACAEQT